MEEIPKSVDAILGEEFLTWLWFKSDTQPDYFTLEDGTPFSIYMEQRIMVRGGEGQSRETASVSGSLSPLKEAKFGLATGKKVCRALIRLEVQELAYQFSIKAEDFTFSSLKTPKIECENDGEPDAYLLEKIYLIEKCVNIFDSIYEKFIKLRLSPAWPEEVTEIENWMHLT